MAISTAAKPDRVAFDARACEVAFGDVVYSLRGVSPAAVSFLRLPLRVERKGVVHLDRVDLPSLRARNRFAKAAGAALGVAGSGIECHLLALLGILEERGKEEAAKIERPLFAAKEAVPDEDRRTARAWLERPDLLDAVARDLARLGYVGEEENKKLAFLVSVSRKLPGPLAAILRASSGSGKSALLDLVARATPPEDVVFLSELTPQALYYLDRDSLKHKLLVVDERAGSERADYPIRTLLSRQTLSLAVTLPDPATGRRATRLVEVEGPVAYLESTTVPLLNPENTSRTLEIFLDESPEQTRRIQAAQREWRRGAAREGDAGVLALLRNAQRLLEPGRVVIPFADRISFPSELPRHRRDHEKFLRLIEASALLHQFQRERKDGAILADGRDYRVAYDLFRPLFSRSGEDLSPGGREVLELLQKRDLREFTRRDVAQALGWSPVRIWRILHELQQADFLVRLPVEADRRHHYRVVEFFPEGSGLSRLLPPEAFEAVPFSFRAVSR